MMLMIVIVLDTIFTAINYDVVYNPRTEAIPRGRGFEGINVLTQSTNRPEQEKGGRESEREWRKT